MLQLKTKVFKQKLIKLLNDIKADKKTKKRLEMLEKEDLDQIQKDAMKFLNDNPDYSSAKISGGRRKKTRRKRKNKNRTRRMRGGNPAVVALVFVGGLLLLSCCLSAADCYDTGGGYREYRAGWPAADRSYYD